MMNHGSKSHRPLCGILRDLFVLVLAEVLVLAVAWCLSPQGRAMLARVFRLKRTGTPNTASPATGTTIDV
jgi:hypothetical protein